MTFQETSLDTGGGLVELELELRPLGAPGGAPHRHIPTERFEITSGLLCEWIQGRRPRLVHAGDIIEIPSESWHFVLALLPSRARVWIRPGMRFDELLVEWAALGSGHLGPMRLAKVLRLLREHGCL